MSTKLQTVSRKAVPRSLPVEMPDSARETKASSLPTYSTEQTDRAQVSQAFRDVSYRHVSVFGVDMIDICKRDALQMLEAFQCAGDDRCRSLFFVNAHTLNTAADDPGYRDVLNESDLVFNDGTGARWAARQRGIELRDNLNGTDLIPEFLQATAGRGYRYFLLGADPETIESAAAVAQHRFPGWSLAGFSHGYIHGEQCEAIIDQINSLDIDLLLVGMGNPLQERWIHANRHRLRVPLAVGVGGLFDVWVDKPRRAPLWVRKLGIEWLRILMQQPHKWRRYLLGNPLFLYRMSRFKQYDIAKMRQRNGWALHRAYS